MSAYMVSKRHIDYLVTAALAAEFATDPDETGRMLWRECLNSLKFRYPGDGDGERPGPAEFRDGDVDTYTFRAASAPTPVALHSLIRCYTYQSCEHPGWGDSLACMLTEALDEPMKDMESDTAWWGPPREEDQPDQS